MSRYWSESVRNLKPYTPGEQPQTSNLLKLNTNENPFPPSPAVVAAIDNFDKSILRLYPDPNAVELKQTLAKMHGLTPQHVFVGNGSDEVLAFAFYAFFKKKLPLLFPDITYSFYSVYCNLWDIDYRIIPLKEGFKLNIEDYWIENGGIILSNPNAPTGRALALDKVKSLLDHNPKVVVVIDEAYVDFAAQSAVKLVADYPNLIVIHTLSKSYSLAGLRVGYAFGDPQLIEGLERIKNSFNSYPLDRLAIKGAVAALLDKEYFEKTRKAIQKLRSFLTTKLKELGFEVVPSSANFVFATHLKMQAVKIYQKLRENGILVRHFNLPRIDNYLRISIGTQPEMEQLIATLRLLLK
jgi:histidinol-phosphate aminotransferase